VIRPPNHEFVTAYISGYNLCYQKKENLALQYMHDRYHAYAGGSRVDGMGKSNNISFSCVDTTS